MTPPVALSSGTLVAHKYRVERLLGQGGMGAVYLAENIDIGRQVAIKLLLPELVNNEQVITRFRLEARAAAAIGHPGIIDVLDLGRAEDGAAFIVMEFLRGESLRDRMNRGDRLSAGEAIAIGDEILAALEAAHQQGVIHRDLKPDNIFLVSQPAAMVKILDFGVSKLMTGDVELTGTGTILGTPLYMPPEQARGTREVGPSADLYSFGAVLYHALAGEPPFQGANYAEVLSKLLTEPARPIDELRPDLPAELSSLIVSLLAKQPDARPPSAQEARRWLARAEVSDIGWAPREASPPEMADQTLDSESAQAGGIAFAQTADPVPARTYAESSVEGAYETKARAPRSRAALFVVAAFVVVAAIVVVVGQWSASENSALHTASMVDATASQSKRETPVQVVAETPASPSRPRSIRLTALPTTARWTKDGQALPACTHTCELTISSGRHQVVTAHAPGYESESVSIGPDHTGDSVAVSLSPRVLRSKTPKSKVPRKVRAAPPGSGKHPTMPGNPFVE